MPPESLKKERAYAPPPTKLINCEFPLQTPANDGQIKVNIPLLGLALNPCISDLTCSMSTGRRQVRLAHTGRWSDALRKMEWAGTSEERTFRWPDTKIWSIRNSGRLDVNVALARRNRRGAAL
jgi:hypothetical protein